MAEAEPNQNTSSQPVFYIGAITLPSSHLALLEFKSSDLITFHLGFNLPGKNGFWHFIWLPCTGSKWAGSLMKLFMGPATQPHSRRVNTHSALLGHPGQSWCGKIPPPPRRQARSRLLPRRVFGEWSVYLSRICHSTPDNKCNFRSAPGIYISISQRCLINVKWLLGVNTAAVCWPWLCCSVWYLLRTLWQMEP